MPSTLSCRSFVHVRSEPRVEHLVDEQIRSWLQAKRWTPFNSATEVAVTVADGILGSAVRIDEPDGTTTRRFRWTQNNHRQTWITEITQHIAPEGASGWIWTDLHGPPAAEPRLPRLTKDLLGILPAYDGAHPLTPEPALTRGTDTDRVRAAILDPRRRGLLFVAGTSPQLPYDQWADYIRTLLDDTRGVAGAHILDAHATEHLNRHLPASHQVPPATMRTFAPHVDLDNTADSYRHRLLSTQRIIDSSTGFLKRLLTDRAFAQSIESQLPTDARRIDRLLRDRLDELLTATIVDEPAPHTHTGAGLAAALDTACTELLGHPPTADDAGDIIDLLRRGRLHDRTAAQLTVTRTRLSQLQDSLDELTDTNRLLQRRFDDEALDHAVIQEELAEERRQRRHLTAQLTAIERSDLVDWDAGAATGLDLVPDTIEELLARLTEFTWVHWTGDDTVAADLDKHSHLTWAARAWEGLRTLESWGACRAGHLTSPGRTLREFVRQPPPDAVTAPPGRFTFVESDATATHRKLKTARIFPVPATVDPTGKTFMAAHYVIGTDSSVSPRMHFLDDTAGTGKVYIGYIGPHLRNTKTN